jgi:hypothetical protein
MTPIIIALGLYVEASGKDAGISADRNASGGTENSLGGADERANERIGL